MAALTLAQLRANVREAMGDNDVKNFDDSAINEAVNWAQLQVAIKLGLTYVDATPFVQNSGVATFTVPSDCIHMERIITS